MSPAPRRSSWPRKAGGLREPTSSLTEATPPAEGSDTLGMSQNEALHWVAELFEESAAGIQPDTSRDAMPNWDSLGVLTLMAGLSERFDVQ